jgi:uncharacterized protein (TIGR02646 family)
MMRMHRTSAPSCLTELHSRKYKGTKYPKYKYWGFIFADKNDASKFDWYGTREILTTELSNITQKHCAFCDTYPLGTGKIKDTIEHFYPKYSHPLLAYYWGNLFLCCHYCQEIPQEWEEKDIKLVLKPDREGYEFDKYFYFDTNTGEIKVNGFNTSKNEQLKAEITIKYYKLNDYERPQARLDAFELYQNITELDKKEYRFMFL